MIHARDTNTKTIEQEWVNVSSSTIVVRRMSKVVTLLLLIKKVRTTMHGQPFDINDFKFCCKISHDI